MLVHGRTRIEEAIFFSFPNTPECLRLCHTTQLFTVDASSKLQKVEASSFLKMLLCISELQYDEARQCVCVCVSVCKCVCVHMSVCLSGGLLRQAGRGSQEQFHRSRH